MIGVTKVISFNPESRGGQHNHLAGQAVGLVAGQFKGLHLRVKLLQHSAYLSDGTILHELKWFRVECPLAPAVGQKDVAFNLGWICRPSQPKACLDESPAKTTTWTVLLT